MNVRLDRRWLTLLFFSVAIFSSSFIYAQQKVSGKITDENAAPLNGVSVVVKGSSTGTTSDEDGNFNITVPSSSSVLVVSYQGYLQREITASTTALNIQLLPDVQRRDLNEVVVVGYGTQRKTTLVSSVTSINTKDIKGPTSNLTTMLA